MEMNNPSALHPFAARHIVKSHKTARKPKFAKEPSSPSLSEAETKKHCRKIETFDFNGRKQPAYNSKSWLTAG